MNELSGFTWPDLSGWRGLPSNCTLATIREQLIVPPGDWYATGYIGEDPRELRWLSASSSTFPESIRVWYRDDRVVAMDTEVSGDARDCAAIASAFGEPAAKLDTYLGNAPLSDGEWVYPDRGLTVHVEPETHVVLRVIVYPATTLHEYRKRYRIVFMPALKYPPTTLRSGVHLQRQNPRHDRDERH